MGTLDNQFVSLILRVPRALPLGVMTWARAALALEVRLGLTYGCSDEVALQGCIVTNIRSRRLRQI